MVERSHSLLQLPKLSPEFLAGIVVQPRLSAVHVGDAERPGVLQPDLRAVAAQVEVVERDEVPELDRDPLRAQQAGLVQGQL